jgi:hypothetical protein
MVIDGQRGNDRDYIALNHALDKDGADKSAPYNLKSKY